MARDNFDFGAAAVGAIIAFGLATVFVVAAGHDGFTRETFCAVSETPVVCTREWANLLAVIAGALTILFLIRGQLQDEQWRREATVTQGLAVLANLNTGRRLAESMATDVRIIENSIELYLKFGGPDRIDQCVWAVRRIKESVEEPEIADVCAVDDGCRNRSTNLLRQIKNFQEKYDRYNALDGEEVLPEPSDVYAKEILESQQLETICDAAKPLTERLVQLASHAERFELHKLLTPQEATEHGAR